MHNYEYEKKQIKDALGDLYFLLKDACCVLAGGAITSLFTQKEINDYDIYFTKQEWLGRIIAEVAGVSDMDYLALYDVKFNFATDRSFLCRTNGSDVQFIHYKIHDDIQSIFNSFDFTVNMGAFDFATEEFVFHEDFLHDLARRSLVFNDATDFPIVSLMRAKKYEGKGYNISKAEMLRIAFTCANKNYDSWDTVKSEVGGLYGVAPDDLFDTTIPFSLKEVVKQLVGVRMKEKFGYSEELNIENIVKLTRDTLDEEFLEWFDTCKKKCEKTGDDWYTTDILYTMRGDKYKWAEPITLDEAVKNLIGKE